MPSDRTDPYDSSGRDWQLDELLAELIRAEEAGESINCNEVVRQHPDLADELNEFFAQRQRIKQIVSPLRDAAARVLHVRCPHCHNPIELVEAAPLTDISCPSCGSSFSLVGDRSSSHFPSVGKSVGHFELLNHVGIGQFGSVWKARDTKLDRTVAIKIPRNGQLDESQTAMFLRDARAAAQLNHPNIVSVHEVGKQDDTLYIVSDFIHGVTLKEWMAANKPTPRESAELCIKIAKALHHAHEAGVIHRDLKPGNIMIERVKSLGSSVQSQTDSPTPALDSGLSTLDSSEPHIVDFGLAKREAGEITMTVEGQILGTPAYMSPEQARGEGHTVDRRADIYSLGVILFELLTGELPFRGDKQMLIVQILNDDPPNPRKLNNSVPRDLETICLKCLEKEPHRRYGSVKLLTDDLNRFLERRSILARRTSGMDRFAKWTRRKPTMAALLGVSTLSVLVLIAGLVVSNVSIGDALDDRTAALARLAVEQENSNEAHRQAQNASQRELRTASRLLYEQSLLQCERGDPAIGLLLLARTLEQAVKTEDSVLENLIRLQLWTWSRHLPRLQWLVEDVGRGVAFSPDSRTIFLGQRDKRPSEFRDVATGDIIGQPLPTDLRFHCAVFSHGGGVLITGVFEADARLFVWDVNSRKIVVEIGGTGDLLNSMAVFPDGNTLFAASPQHAESYDIGSGKRLREFLRRPAGDNGEVISISPDGKLILTPGKTARIWNSETGKEIHSFLEPDYAVVSAFSKDGSRAITGTAWSSARIWDSATGEQVGATLFHGSDQITSVAISPDGRYALTASYGFARLWDLRSGRPVGPQLRHVYSEVDPVSFSPDGKWMITVGGSARLWRTPDELRTKAPSDWRPPENASTSVVEREGRSISVKRGKELSTAVLRNRQTGERIGPPLRHSSNVSVVALSPDGAIALSGADDGTAKFWCAKTGDTLGPTLQHQGQVRKGSFSDDGTRAVMITDTDESYWWRVPKPLEGKPERVTLWVQVITGMEIGETRQVQFLEPLVWQQRRDALNALGGCPTKQ